MLLFWSSSVLESSSDTANPSNSSIMHLFREIILVVEVDFVGFVL